MIIVNSIRMIIGKADQLVTVDRLVLDKVTRP